jgi:uncharacterized protein (DUF488 family)
LIVVNKLYTLGYESAAIEDFIATLKIADVERVIDIREYPVSRRKGFSKSILQALLQANNIDYVHLKGLGDPKEGRDAARAGDHKKFVRIFTEHMKTAQAVADLKTAIDLAGSSVSCLLCYEREPTGCHRTIVAKAIAADTGQPVHSIGIPKGIASREQFQTVYPGTDYA